MANVNGQSVIQIKGLYKSFGRQTVLKGIDLNVKGGETVAILGRSGTGKSVLLKMMIGLQQPDSGSVVVQGKELGKLSLDELNLLRRQIGFLFQNSALFDSVTVEENVAFPLIRHSGLSASETKDRVYKLLASVGVENAAGKLPAQLSGGMQKRVALARALALQPQILLCDEPTTGQDPITSAEITELIKGMQQQHSVTSVIVTHDLHNARVLADRVVLLHKGETRLKGTFQDLLSSEDPFIRSFVRQSVPV